MLLVETNSVNPYTLGAEYWENKYVHVRIKLNSIFSLCKKAQIICVL